MDLALRSRAAHLLVQGRGVVGGYSAAELLGASCGPRDAPAEVVVAAHQRAQPGLRVHRARLAPDQSTVVDGVGLTTPVRTAYDLARRLARIEAVVAVDALAHRYGFAPSDVLAPVRRHPGALGSTRLHGLVRLADPRAESPMETRIRLAIIDAGLPAPVLQHPVGPYLLDLAYPRVRLGIEYDGAEHRTQERAMRDLERQSQRRRLAGRAVPGPGRARQTLGRQLAGATGARAHRSRAGRHAR